MAIKVYRSSDTGAPVLKGQLSGFIGVLDGLCAGYGAVTTPVITRSGAIATVVTTGAHNIEDGAIVVVSGCDQTEYNGEFKITLASATQFTYTVSGTPATPATGTPAIKRAPIGMTKVFSDTHKAVYRFDNVNSTRLYLRVVDDGSAGGGAKECLIYGYETMSDVDTGTALWATRYLWKSNAVDTSARGWIAVTDGHILYMFISPTTSYSGYALAQTALVFGDIVPTKANDAYRCILGAQIVENYTGSAYIDLWNPSSTFGAAASYYMAMPRPWTALPGGVAASLVYNAPNGANCFGCIGSVTYPNGPDNGFYMSPCMVVNSSPSANIRGIMPGLYEPLHGFTHDTGSLITDVQGYSGRTFLTIRATHYNTSGTALIDITGPWR